MHKFYYVFCSDFALHLELLKWFVLLSTCLGLENDNSGLKRVHIEQFSNIPGKCLARIGQEHDNSALNLRICPPQRFFRRIGFRNMGSFWQFSEKQKNRIGLSYQSHESILGQLRDLIWTSSYRHRLDNPVGQVGRRKVLLAEIFPVAGVSAAKYDYLKTVIMKALEAVQGVDFAKSVVFEVDMGKMQIFLVQE